MKIRRFLYCFICLILIACGGKEDLATPNILWITSEDNSKHYLSLFDEHGVETPNIARLAAGGVKFTRAFSNAPVCSVARSTLISGCYAPRVGSQFHRKIEKVPMPRGLEMFPAYLKAAGYYTSNNSKEDYNFFKSDTVWDDSSNKATWRDRETEQPFFHVQNIHTTHESRLHFSQTSMDTTATDFPQNDVFVFPNHPQTKLFRYTNAYYRDKVTQMDSELGDVLAQLEEDGLMDETIIFYFGDHGGVLPGSKGYLYESGLHVPFVVHAPEQYREWLGVERGGEHSNFVSFVDFGPTVLHLAGLPVPQEMDGQPFLGPNLDWEEVTGRNSTFGYADRFDEKYDLVRSLRVGDYKYIRSFQPYNFDGLMNNYRYKQLAFREWSTLYEGDLLNEAQAAFFRPRAPEMLFDLRSDPYETTDLSGDPAYADKLLAMRSQLSRQMKGLPDLSMIPEHALLAAGASDMAVYGQQEQERIATYVDLANASLQPFAEVRQEVAKALTSSDSWERYWAITSCTVMGGDAAAFGDVIRSLATSDKELVNRMRAAEFLAIVMEEDPMPLLLESLYLADEPAEGLLLLNSIVLIRDGLGYDVTLDLGELQPAVRENSEVERRLLYLAPEQIES